jgi:hypothetical protein
MSVLILHFQPLEAYPPIMNLLNFLSKEQGGRRIEVITTRAANSVLPEYRAPGNIPIKRAGRTGLSMPAASRYFNYLLFNSYCLLRLLIARPDRVLYYETLSSYPPYLYKRFVNRKAQLFIHYHEYTSREEYRTGMKLQAFFHKREQMLYSRASWISHTNEERMKMFTEDESLGPLHTRHLLPNYPPRSWAAGDRSRTGSPIKFVYAGALSMDTMYTRQFAEWIEKKKGAATWDIYSTNISESARSYLQGLNSEFIRLHDGVDYFALPDILRSYHVGVILYNGHIPNYIYNAPNKLFEYLASGLDVWFPDVMKGARPYITRDTYPKVVEVDFTRMDGVDMEHLLLRTGLQYKPSEFYAEEVFSPLANRLLNNLSNT